MALIFPGASKCGLCDKVFHAEDEIVGTSHFIRDDSHPLERFSRVGMHRECFLQWPQRQEFVNLFNAAYDATLSPLTFADGTYRIIAGKEVFCRQRSEDIGPVRWKVLVIDDQFEEVEALLSALSQHRIQAQYASSGAEGLEMARKELPDLILCDLRMPGMTGIEFMEEVEIDPSIRLVAIFLMDIDWVVGVPGAINAWSKPTPSGRTADAHWSKPIDIGYYVGWILHVMPTIAR